MYGLLYTIKEDHEFAQSSDPKEGPLMKHTYTDRHHKFDPLWYPQLISMTEESLDSMGFGPNTIGKGNLGDQKHWRQRIRTQMIDGNSQSDVTVQDLEELSRAPMRRKTEVGHCQKVCQDGAKL